MSYLTQNEIAGNPAMVNRIAQAVTQEGNIPAGMTADNWTVTYRRVWGAAPGWDAAWESSKVSHPDDPDSGEAPYDPGEDEGVITDQMILSQVQAMLNAPAEDG